MNMEEIYTLAQSDMRARRSKAIQNAEINKMKALQNDDYLNIANKIGALTIEVAKARFYKTCEEKRLESELKVAKDEEEKILSSMGLKSSDLEPKFECSLCRDKGVDGNKYCSCFNELISFYTNKYNMNTLQEISFKDCDKIDKKLVEKMIEITETYPEKRSKLNIYICGDIGVGKTQLTQAMANAFLNKGLYTIFTTATNLNANFLEYHKCFNDNKKLYLHHFLECDVLFIDDLGTEPILNNVTREYLLMVISERILAKKLTIITSNLNSPADISKRYSERLFSRLFDKNLSITVNVKGDDLRLKKK